MAQNIGPTITLKVDPTGSSEARPCPFDFSNDPLILKGDTLSSATPEITAAGPSGQPNLTFGTATLSGEVWKCEVSIAATNAQPGTSYTATCRATTTAGFTIIAENPVVIGGTGYQPPTTAPAGPATVAAATFFAGPISAPNATPTYRALVATDLPTSGVTSGAYGDATHVASVTVDQFGRATSASSVPIEIGSSNLLATGITAGNQGDASHIPVFNIGADGRAISLTNTPMVVRDQGGQVFNVRADKYGAKGDGTTDDTAAIQSAVNDALAVSGEVFFPPPSSTYKITSTISIGGSAGHQQTVSMRAPPIQLQHSAGLITYAGSSNSSVFVLLGITDWRFENIGVTLNSDLSNVVIWDQQYSSTYPNSGLARLVKCNTVFSGNTNCIWFRFGQSTGGGASNGYSTKFDHCLVNEQTANSGNIAVQIGGSQNYSPSFYDCTFTTSCNILAGPIASQLTGSVTQNVSTTIPVADTLLFPSSGTISIGGQTAAYTSKSVSTGPGNLVLASTWTGSTFGTGSQCSYSVPNQGVYSGNCSFKFRGGELSGNSWGYDVLLLAPGYCNLDTLQCQNATAVQRRFLQIGVGNASSPIHVEMKSVVLKNYLPVSTVDSNGLIWLHWNATLELNKCTINNGTTAFGSTGNAWIISNNGATAFGNIRMKDCDFFATFPFINNSASGVGWPVEYNHVQLDNSAGNPTSVLNNDPHIYRTITAATYTVTTGNDYTIACNCTNNAVATALPSCASVPAGWTYVFEKTDASANAATVTPNGTDKINGAANYVLSTQYSAVAVRTDGVSNWYIVAKI